MFSSPALRQTLRTKGLQSLASAAAKRAALRPTALTRAPVASRLFATRPEVPPDSNVRTSNLPYGEPILRGSPESLSSASKTELPSAEAQAAAAGASGVSGSEFFADDSEYASQDFEEFIVREECGATSSFAPWLTTFAVLGMSLGAYAMAHLVTDMPMWPEEVRRDLFNGFRSSLRGDRTMSALNLSHAWETAKGLPAYKFGREPFLKITGIAIALAGAYDADGKANQAYQIYQEALAQLSTSGLDPTEGVLRPDLSPAERIRAVAISYKLGELAKALGKPPAEEEKWLVYSVESALRDVMHMEPVMGVVVKRDNQEVAKGVIEAMKLPPMWRIRHDLATPFEALGNFYSRFGKANLALPLYFQAISLLNPPPPLITSTSDMCRAAHVMGQISEVVARSNPKSPEALKEAESWAKQGLDMISNVRGDSPRAKKQGACEIAYAFMLYNLAMVRELMGDKSQADSLLHDCLDQSKSIGLREGIQNAEKAIKELTQGKQLMTSLLPDTLP